MADIAELAEHQEHLAREAGLANAHRPTGPAPTGRCHYCDEILDDVRRWCGAECRGQWELENRK